MESPPPAAHMPLKKRKATYLVRKEEAEDLKDQINILQLQLELLEARAKQTAMLPEDHRRLLGQSKKTKNLLQRLVRNQGLVIAGAQSEITNFQESQPVNPLYTRICMPTSWDKRQKLLLELKEEMLTRACDYVLTRSRHLDLLRNQSSEQRFQDAQGAFYCQRFEVAHLFRVKSLKQVYDAARFFLTNVEISTSEALGFITVREDYDVDDDESTSNFRLISKRPCGITTESNKVLYNKYFDRHELFDGRPCGIMVTDSVDDDELYPYHPDTRVRLDVSASLVITEAKVKKPTYSQGINHYANVLRVGADHDENANENHIGELNVVIYCTPFLKVNQPEFDVPEDIVSTIMDCSRSWVKVMVKTIRDIIAAS